MSARLTSWFFVLGLIAAGVGTASRCVRSKVAGEDWPSPAVHGLSSEEFVAPPAPEKMVAEVAIREQTAPTAMFAEGVSREGVLSSAAYTLGLDDAVALLAVMPSGDDRAAMVSGIMDAMMKSSPADGALLFDALPAADRSHRLSNQLINVWAAHDPAGAAAWSVNLPLGGAREDAVMTIVQTWLSRDAVAALAWVVDLPEGAPKIQALRFAGQYLDGMRSDPE